MRKRNLFRTALVAGITMAPILALAPAASAEPADCSVSISASGVVASAYCNGGSGPYQIVIRCSNLETIYGNVARAPGGNSSADCRQGVVTDYAVRALVEA